MKFKTRRRKRREALEEAEAKEKKNSIKPDHIPEQPKPKINLPPRRKTKPSSGK